jgi:hypothetical protein
MPKGISISSYVLFVSMSFKEIYIYIYIYIMLPIHNSDDVVMSRRNLKFSLMLFVKTRALQ